MNEKIEEQLKLIRKKMKDSKATIFWGVEYSSDSKPDWRARIVPTRSGVNPFLAGSDTKEGLLKELEVYLANGNIKDIMYHYLHNQIDIHKEAIKFNEDLIKDYENLPS